MKEVDNSTVIDLTSNPKNAVLYFDYVLPLSPLFYNEVVTTCHPIPTTDVSSVLPPKIINSEKKYLFYWMYFQDFVCSETKELNTMPDIIPDREESWCELISFVKKNIPSDTKVIYPAEIGPSDIYCGNCYECSQIRLSRLPLIDTTNSKWEQIIEIRKDKNSIKKLRKLKTFFYENYSGKEKNFIHDPNFNLKRNT